MNHPTPCSACDGLGFVRPPGPARWGTGSCNILDPFCEACGGTGYPTINPAAPIPVPPGPERVAYYQARYAAGYALQTAGDAQSDT